MNQLILKPHPHAGMLEQRFGLPARHFLAPQPVPLLFTVTPHMGNIINQAGATIHGHITPAHAAYETAASSPETVRVDVMMPLIQYQTLPVLGLSQFWTRAPSGCMQKGVSKATRPAAGQPFGMPYPGAGPGVPGMSFYRWALYDASSGLCLQIFTKQSTGELLKALQLMPSILRDKMPRLVEHAQVAHSIEPTPWPGFRP